MSQPECTCWNVQGRMVERSHEPFPDVRQCIACNAYFVPLRDLESARSELDAHLKAATLAVVWNASCHRRNGGRDAHSFTIGCGATLDAAKAVAEKYAQIASRPADAIRWDSPTEGGDCWGATKEHTYVLARTAVSFSKPETPPRTSPPTK